MVIFTKERTQTTASKKKKKSHLGFWNSMWQTAKNPNFVRIFLLYQLVGLSMGIFIMIGSYLNIYWVMGSALGGTEIHAWVSMVAWTLGLVALPLIQWGCARFQKHVVLRVALLLMIIGTAIKWWAYFPGHPERQFIMPFFFSLGIGSYYAVLSTMMADVTDHDELITGHRREGMFGATMAFLMKFTGSITPVLSGAVLVIAGFDPALEYNQTPETIFNMRLMFSFIPAGMLLFGLLILWRYPLTRERMAEIKATLKERRQAAIAAEQHDG